MFFLLGTPINSWIICGWIYDNLCFIKQGATRCLLVSIGRILLHATFFLEKMSGMVTFYDSVSLSGKRKTKGCDLAQMWPLSVVGHADAEGVC